jgi:hypothetical protein
METAKLLWSLVSILVALIFFFFKNWISSIKDIQKTLGDRVDKGVSEKYCFERHNNLMKDIDALIEKQHNLVTEKQSLERYCVLEKKIDVLFEKQEYNVIERQCLERQHNCLNSIEKLHKHKHSPAGEVIL